MDEAISAVLEWQQGEYTISTDPARLDVGVIHRFLSEDSYWAQGISRKVVERGIAHSLNFGIYHGERHVGGARVITDYATHAYVCDVFIIEEYRGCGLSKWLMGCIMAHPELQEVRTWLLATGDAHGLYRQFGFSGVVELDRHEAYMARQNPGIYQRIVEGAERS